MEFFTKAYTDWLTEEEIYRSLVGSIENGEKEAASVSAATTPSAPRRRCCFSLAANEKQVRHPDGNGPSTSGFNSLCRVPAED